MIKRIKNIVYKIQKEESPLEIYNFFLLAVATDFLSREREKKIQDDNALEQKIINKGENYE